ncbi:ASST-domain-containing protein [Aspergillus avenaceus]|uniref:ASST-domain-containing protein n=1 Tax=Aspergillus avenaceus TaxID=36643 RepID=A0A5N6U6H3_ASPAV|nr:ASST-domain-containing protein [Aspergillus avenaceus]
MMLDGLLIVLALFLVSVCADSGPYLQSSAYDEGRFGEWPTETYRSSPIVGPALNYLQHSDKCKDGLYTFIAPRGSRVAHPGPMILDQDGHLVWTTEYGQSYNLNVYNYKGQDYLTFWMGNDGVGGHGEGAYYMLDSSYQEVYKIDAANHLPADLHEFHMTEEGTALITIYDVYPADLRPVGGLEEGWIWDGTFQEFDIETGKLLFQWRASEHFEFTDVIRDREGNGDSESRPWDFFHINSVDKDAKGNYLISSRYASCLTYINGSTGAIIWRLGGKNNDFEDLSDGAATDFSWQHHARFRDNGTAITMFDNASRGGGAPELTSRGLYLDIDQENMTVKVRHEYWNPSPISSQSQGSVQLLDNSNVLVGYGHVPTWTEYSIDGDVLCDVHFGAASGDGNIMSYRVFKYPWIGNPQTSPDIAVYQYEVAVSWNGATEVVTWALEGASSNSHKTESTKFVTAMPKSGFETIIPIPQDATHKYIRALALNSTGQVIGSTKLVRWDPTSPEPVVGRHDDKEMSSPVRSVVFFIVGFSSAVLLAAGAWLARRCYDSRPVSAPKDKERGDWQPLDRFNGDEDLSEGEMDDVEFSLLGHSRASLQFDDDFK